MTTVTPLLRASGIDKYAYDDNGQAIRGTTVQLLHGVELEVAGGEIHALIGENGAGKSTLIKVIGGAIPPESGMVELGGEMVRFGSSRDARRHGVSVIWQEFSLAPKLTVLENMFLGEEPTRAGRLDRSTMRRRAAAAFARLGVSVPLGAVVASLSTSEQQIVEIAKALDRDARLLVLDEPTASLTSVEAQRLFVVLHELRAKGLGILLVTHRFDEVFEMADRVTVMKDGRTTGVHTVAETTREELIEQMVGRALESYFVRPTATAGDAILEVDRVTRGTAVYDASIFVRTGEIVTLAGLVGAGRTELCRIVMGADRADTGSVRFDGRDVSRWSIGRRLDAGMAFVPEDRKSQGVIVAMSVRRNIAVRGWRRMRRGPLLAPRRERELARRQIDNLRISINSPEQPASTLSGGNQQRVAIAKWMEPAGRLYIFDEPTRGVDVGARRALYALIAGLVEGGAGVLMVSSDLPEVLGMSDRVYVMRGGSIAAEVPIAEASEQKLLGLMLPAHDNAA
jgi:ABC-type sugar transport system ATPase subunit